jgi:hypothetical protein
VSSESTSQQRSQLAVYITKNNAIRQNTEFNDTWRPYTGVLIDYRGVVFTLIGTKDLCRQRLYSELVWARPMLIN